MKISKNVSLVSVFSVLIIIQIISPMVIGYNTVASDNDKEQFRRTISNDGIESEEVTTTSGLMDSWPMLCHDARHTGRSQYSTANNPYEERWWFKTTHEENYYYDHCFVNIADGTIYFTDVDGCIYAIYPNGTLKWRFEDFDRHDTIECHPAIDEDGIIYVGTAHGDFYAIYPNGTLKWKYEFNRGVTISSSPAIGNGIIYFGTCNNGYLYAFYSNGTIRWRYKLVSGCTCSSPAIADDGTIYIGDNAGYLYAIYPNGTLRWKVRLQNNYWISSSPSIADDRTIYIATCNANYPGHLYAVNPDNGNIKWKYQIGSDYYVNPSLGEDGTIYALVSKNPYHNPETKLYAINSDGTEKWTHKLGSGYIVRCSDPAISEDGTIYVAAGGNVVENRNYLYAFNSDGTERWCKEFDVPCLAVESSPVIGEDGTVYLGLSHYKLHPPQDYSWTLYLHAFNERDPNAPSAPEINGPTKGVPRECYNYTIVSTDPNGDDIYYYVSWGEGSRYDPMVGWFPSELVETGPFPSGEEITINHTWLFRDRYTIKVIAKDTNNLVSPWTTSEVIMPKDKMTANLFFLQLLERFPNAFTLLRQLLGLALYRVF